MTPPRPTEAACQATIIAAAKRGGWRIHAERTTPGCLDVETQLDLFGAAS